MFNFLHRVLLFFCALNSTINCQDVNWTELVSELKGGEWYDNIHDCMSKELRPTSIPLLTSHYYEREELYNYMKLRKPAYLDLDE